MASSPTIEVRVSVDPPEVDVRHNMTNHRPTEAEIAVIEAIRERFISLGNTVQMNCPPSNERSLALTNLEQALMWAVASIARNTENPDA